MRPPGVEQVGLEAWSPEGLVVLGTPVGHAEFVQAKVSERVAEEQKLLDAVCGLPDPQCAWQLLSKCSGPRASYLIGTLPPSTSREYAEEHDERLWPAAVHILGAQQVDLEAMAEGRLVARLPARLGGLGLRSAVRVAPAAYWASWADTLPMIVKRSPHQAQKILECLASAPQGCLGELSQSATLLDAEGFDSRPTWNALASGTRPPRPEQPDLGEWAHG